MDSKIGNSQENNFLKIKCRQGFEIKTQKKNRKAKFYSRSFKNLFLKVKDTAQSNYISNYNNIYLYFIIINILSRNTYFRQPQNEFDTSKYNSNFKLFLFD